MRQIFCASNGALITAIEQLEAGGTYVTAGSEKFRPGLYGSLGSSSSPSTPDRCEGEKRQTSSSNSGSPQLERRRSSFSNAILGSSPSKPTPIKKIIEETEKKKSPENKR